MVDRRRVKDFEAEDLVEDTPSCMQVREFEDSSFNETRAAQLAMSLYGHTGSNFNVPKEKIPGNMRYAFGRDSVMGKQDQARIADLYRKYWRPVPVSRHPEMAAIDLFNRRDPRISGSEQGFIHDRGLVMFERDKRYDDVEQKVIREQNKKSLDSLPGLGDIKSDRRFPVMKNRSVDRFHGSETHFGN